jgi:hypothetical protein
MGSTKEQQDARQNTPPKVQRDVSRARPRKKPTPPRSSSFRKGYVQSRPGAGFTEALRDPKKITGLGKYSPTAVLFDLYEGLREFLGDEDYKRGSKAANIEAEKEDEGFRGGWTFGGVERNDGGSVKKTRVF